MMQVCTLRVLSIYTSLEMCSTMTSIVDLDHTHAYMYARLSQTGKSHVPMFYQLIYYTYPLGQDGGRKDFNSDLGECLVSS